MKYFNFRKKSPDQISLTPAHTLTPVQQVAVVQPQKKVTPSVTPEVKKKEPTIPPQVQEEVTPEPDKKKVKPSVQFKTETEIVPRERISYTENAYEEIHQAPEYADTDEVIRSEHHSRSGNHVLSPGDFSQPLSNDVVIGPQIVPMETTVPDQYGGHISPQESGNSNSPQPVTYSSNTGTYPPNHGHGNGNVNIEMDETHSSTVPAKVRKAKKGGKRYITPKRFRGKPKNEEKFEDDVIPAVVTPTFMIPEEDRMY